MVQEFLDILEKYGALKDDQLNLAECALAIAAIDSPGISIDRYKNHIKKLENEVAIRHQDLLDSGANDDAGTQLAALKHIISDTYDYVGDKKNYDDLQNVNLMRVIDRRKGMPVSLALIYIHVGLSQGWHVEALNFPAHVVCRIEKNGERILFDPFNKCKVLNAYDLRKLLKTLVSPHAELSNHYYEPATRREIIIRMQNNIKLRQIEGEDYLGAIKTIDIMRLLDPDEYRLLFDAGVLYARTNQAVAAINVLEEYLERTTDHNNKHDANVLLRQIRESLN